MIVEHKFVELKSLKVSDKGPGIIEGYRAVFSVDEGGDLIVKGAFADTIEEYLSSGFSAESHDWTFSRAIGFPVVAREDSHGFWVQSQFHSTPDAQNVRIKAQERMAAGKKVGFSFGYSADEVDYIDAHNYERELPRYVKSAELSYNLAQAKKFSRVRLLKKISMIEDSLVTAPMNRQASATSVKHGFSRNMKTEAEVFWRRSRSLEQEASVIETLYGSRLGLSEADSTIRKLKLLRKSQELQLKCKEFLNGPYRIDADTLRSVRQRLKSAMLRLRVLN